MSLMFRFSNTSLSCLSVKGQFTGGLCYRKGGQTYTVPAIQGTSGQWGYFTIEAPTPTVCYRKGNVTMRCARTIRATPNILVSAKNGIYGIGSLTDCSYSSREYLSTAQSAITVQVGHISIFFSQKSAVLYDGSSWKTLDFTSYLLGNERVLGAFACMGRDSAQRTHEAVAFYSNRRIEILYVTGTNVNSVSFPPYECYSVGSGANIVSCHTSRPTHGLLSAVVTEGLAPYRGFLRHIDLDIHTGQSVVDIGRNFTLPSGTVPVAGMFYSNTRDTLITLSPSVTGGILALYELSDTGITLLTNTHNISWVSGVYYERTYSWRDVWISANSSTTETGAGICNIVHISIDSSTMKVYQPSGGRSCLPAPGFLSSDGRFWQCLRHTGAAYENVVSVCWMTADMSQANIEDLVLDSSIAGPAYGVLQRETPM